MERKPGRVVLSLYENSGNMVRPWAEEGFECFCLDLRNDGHSEQFDSGGSIAFIPWDMRNGLPVALAARERAITFCFSPCTNLAISGARWFQGKGMSALIDGLTLLEAGRQIADGSEAPWMLENPIGVISSYWRKPDYVFQPWMYGDMESKLTCLWTGNGFVMPDAERHIRPAEVRESVWRMAPSEDRGHKRSVTSPGFARAVYEANGAEQFAPMRDEAGSPHRNPESGE